MTVALTSGRSANISIPQSSKGGDLRLLAQQSLGQGFLKLVSSQGCILADPEAVEAAGLQDGDQLTAIARKAHLAASGQAFALWCCGSDGVVTWGDPNDGGDSSAVQHQLMNVRQVWATGVAFAAILEDGSVVTWGDSDYGGDSSAIQHQLRNVQQVQATGKAFAAILEGGSVVTCGYPDDGGDSFTVQKRLRNVQQVRATGWAFAAILEDGSVVTWGNPKAGGNSAAVQNELQEM